jgi:hypothetical protein
MNVSESKKVRRRWVNENAGEYSIRRKLLPLARMLLHTLRSGCVAHVTWMGKMTDVYKVLIRKFEK